MIIEEIVKIRKKLFNVLVSYEVGDYKDNIDKFYKDLCDVYKELAEKTMTRNVEQKESIEQVNN